MAQIRKRTDSTYQIIVCLGRDSEGRRYFKRTTYTPTATTPKAIQTEVEDYARDFEKRVKNGEVLDGESMTFREFVEIWKETSLLNLTPRTQDEYKRQIEAHFMSELGFMPMSDIKATHIDRVLHKMRKEGKAPKTIRYTFTAINSVMKYAFKKGYINENPCLRCDDLPKVTKDNDLHFFTVPQAKTFLNALTLEYEEKRAPVTRHLKNGTSYEVGGYTIMNKIPFQWRAYFNIAIYGGFRRGEILALTWEDIDEVNHTINIEKAISRTFKEEIVKEPKTVAGKRCIRLPKETFSILREWKVKQKELSFKLGTAWEGYRGDDFDKNYIFIDLNTGKRMSIDTPTHKFKEIISLYNSQKAQGEEDKLPEIRLHDLRHTSATLLLTNGTDIETVSKRLGHSKASVTLDVYGHAMEEADVTASDTLEKLFA